MSETAMTVEQIEGTIRAARDSVWVVTDSLEKLANGAELSNELRGNIERNVGHLKLVVANPEISGSGQDISDLHAAITNGEAALA
jgi:hypothetical protein